MSDAASIIRTKRDGGVLDRDALRWFTRAVAADEVGQAQLGAFLMAVYLQGMNASEQADLTLAMRDSGDVMHWPDLDGPVLDKHSTGGVGDLVSLVLGPLIAACGGYVPMISGRGLGHTGGTLDKMESIPGLTVTPPLQVMRNVVRDAGFAMVGQGPNLAPADRRMYAVRDVTATVSCQPLIVSSILSKKLCEGLDGLVMDIKTGNGAIMTDRGEALALGQAICDVAVTAGLPCTALVTDMDQPLAHTAGNALEMREALDFLTGGPRHPRLAEVIFGLCRELLALGGLESDPEQAQELLERALDSGAAAERFARMVAGQGGPADLLERPNDYLARAPIQQPLPASRSGVISALDTRAFGEVVKDLGGGRHRVEDVIDPAVGLSDCPGLGQAVSAGDPLLTIHAASAADAERVASMLLAAITISDEAPEPAPTISERLTAASEPPAP